MEEIGKLIDEYGEHDSTYKALGKVCDEEKTKIKDTLFSMGLNGVSGDNYKVVRSVQTRESLDETRLLSGILQLYGESECPYVKTVQIVDMDAIEMALYKNELPIEVRAKLLECKRTQEVVTLRVSKIKK